MLSKLYFITDRSQCKDLFYTIEKALIAGLRLIQLREKDLPGSDLYKMALELRKLTMQYSATLIINDRVDIALAVDADGVHLGVNSIPISAVKKLVPKAKKFYIGYSAHSLNEAISVEQSGVDFITFSPIFQTDSKMKYGSPQGIAKLNEVCNSVTIPVYALGGVKYHHATEILSSGAYGLAFISELLHSTDPQKKVKELLSFFNY